jgi:hypothetical protein
MYRARFQLILKNPRNKRKIDDISCERKKSRSTFFRRGGTRIKSIAYEDLTVREK